jgi:hypothetical protein
MQGLNKQPDKKELRSFGFITGGLTPVIFGLLLPWLFDHDFPRWPWIVSAILIVWAIVLPMSLKPVYRVWMTIGLCLGWINTRIILSIMFYFIILPTGLILRLLGKDPMTRSIIKEQKSYRVTSTVPDKKHIERPY